MTIVLINFLVLLVIQTLFVVYLRSANASINWFDCILVYVVTTVVYLFGVYTVSVQLTQGLIYG